MALLSSKEAQRGQLCMMEQKCPCTNWTHLQKCRSPQHNVNLLMFTFLIPINRFTSCPLLRAGMYISFIISSRSLKKVPVATTDSQTMRCLFKSRSFQKNIYGLLLGLVCHFVVIRTLTFHRPESDFSGNGGWTALPQHDMDVIGGIKDAKGHR